jgi:hypothetical protein
MLHELLGVQSPKLRAKIWAHYPASTVLKWQLEICAEPARTPQDTVARMRRLGDLLSPALLVRAAEALTPPGKSRHRELIEFEERVLSLTAKDGTLRW